ncbi:MAG: putative secreted hydrolase [Gammaproteobacteria bacterium]|jgi:predicted secreted hydrolase
MALCAIASLPACKEGAADADARRYSLAAATGDGLGAAIGALGGAPEAGYARALAPRPFRFPADHGSHPDFRAEWWYFTGNLQAEDGRRFGFQLTLFRRALAPAGSTTARTSRFATRQAWMGHFALSDVDADDNDRSDSDSGRRDGKRANRASSRAGSSGQFHAFERLERGAAGLAGARAHPFRVWLRDWVVSGGDELFPLHLRAAEGGVAVDLQLGRGKALVLQGDRGLSRKNSKPGNASYYYSFTRLPASGLVRTADGVFRVTGQAWLDREWSSRALAADQSGWDWFALQLDDGRDLMVYRLRDQHGATHPYSAGVLVAANGTSTPLAAEQLSFSPGRIWRSATGERYPVVWDLRAGDLQLKVRALFDSQAHGGRFRYWEGAVQAQGRDGEVPVSARGYLEMTGYPRH